MKNLYSAQSEQTYEIISLPENPLLETLGIFEGAKIIKKTTYKMGGPVLLLIQLREVAIGKDLAIQIQVEKCEVN